jgi:hypothetical protein
MRRLQSLSAQHVPGVGEKAIEVLLASSTDLLQTCGVRLGRRDTSIFDVLRILAFVIKGRLPNVCCTAYHSSKNGDDRE